MCYMYLNDHNTYRDVLRGEIPMHAGVAEQDGGEGGRQYFPNLNLVPLPPYMYLS